MKYHSPMIVVADIAATKRFYTNVLNETTALDLENYIVFSGGFSAMTRAHWRDLTHDAPADRNAGHSFELYFEEENFSAFIEKLQRNGNIAFFTPPGEAPWGQRTVRFLDPDGMVVEVAEPMAAVVDRLVAEGLTDAEIRNKTSLPVSFAAQRRALYVTRTQKEDV